MDYVMFAVWVALILLVLWMLRQIKKDLGEVEVLLDKIEELSRLEICSTTRAGNNVCNRPPPTRRDLRATTMPKKPEQPD